MIDGTYTVELSETSWETFRIKTATGSARQWVSRLYSPSDDYELVAEIVDNEITLRRSADSILVKALELLISDPETAGERYALKSGCCYNCGRELIVPASLHRGLGPTCAATVAARKTETVKADPVRVADAEVQQASACSLDVDGDLLIAHTAYKDRERAKKVTSRQWQPYKKAWTYPLTSARSLADTFPEYRQTEAFAAVLRDARPLPYAEVDGRSLLVFSEIADVETCRLVPDGIWDQKRRAWRYPATSAEKLSMAFSGRLGTDEAFEALIESTREATAVREAASAFKANGVELEPIECTATEAWRHQLVGYRFVEKLPAAMLAMDMGTGKSKIVVDLVVNRGHEKVLILCPKAVVDVWPREFKAHAGRAVRVLALQGGSVKKRVEEADRFLKAGDGVVVINYDAARAAAFADWSTKRQWSLVVADESHKAKSPSGVTSRYLAKLGRRAEYRLALTGTPMPHTPLDIWGQYRFLDETIYGTSFVRFRNYFSIMGGWQGKEFLGIDPERAEELTDRLYSIAYRVEATDVLDLPPTISMTRRTKLSKAARETYDDLETSFVAGVTGGIVTAANALVSLLRLAQVTSGYVTTDDQVEVDLDESKAGLLAETLDELPVTEPVVVFCRFRHDLDVVRDISRKGGRRYGELSGRANDLTEEAKMPEHVDVLGVQIQSGGVGVDLTRAAYAIYFSMGFSLGDYEQSLARLDRPGQTRSVRYVHLLVEDSVDEQIMKALAARQDVVAAILKETRPD